MEGEKIIFLDPRAGDLDPVSKATRTYRVAAVLPAFSSQVDLYTRIGQPAIDWLWEGFNATGEAA